MVKEIVITDKLVNKDARAETASLQDRNVIYLEPWEVFDGSNDCFSHEIEHAADNADGRKAMAKSSEKNADPDQFLNANDHVWAALNPTGPSVYSRRTSRMGNRPIGFAEWNGKKNENEDQAEVARLVLTEPIYAHELAREDSVLAAKIAAWKQIVYHRTQGLMGPKYWQDLLYGRFNEGYWD